MRILGIETSCDETAICVLECDGGAEKPTFKVLANALYSQAKLHAEFGGVFPMLAKREHLKNLPVLLKKVLEKVGENKIDAIAVTVGPGLEPALWTGVNFSEELGKKWQVPVIPTNHMEGHIAAVLTQGEVKFPALALLISGGHTELVLAKKWGEYEVLGQTRDDAVGEAFDKVARILGLPYPGGPEISRLAKEARRVSLAAPFSLPRPMLKSDDYDFSFSGLKTAVLYSVKKIPELTAEVKMAVAREFEDAAAEVLVSKTRKALEQFGTPTLILGGGVSANTFIRESFKKLVEEFPETTLLVPDPSMSTDNAVMIAMASYLNQNQTSRPMIANGNLSF